MLIQTGTMPIKKTQGFFDNPSKLRTVPQYGCVVMEVQDWIDGINNPAWQREPKQVIGPATVPYELEATYDFFVKK
jgi:aldose 1-epimerase